MLSGRTDGLRSRSQAITLFSLASCTLWVSTAAGQVVTLSNTTILFGNVAMGTTSTRSLTITNSGTSNLVITSITATGNFHPAKYANAIILPRANFQMSVSFTPPSLGSNKGTLSISDNATGSPHTVSLSGTGIAPVVSLSPTTLAFGNEPVDMTSAVKAVTLSNTGNAALSLTSIAFTGTNASNFAQANTCGSSVAPGGHCPIVVMFTPSASGNRTAALSISDNAAGSPQTVSLSGSGTHDVILSWDASPTPGVVGYNIYRAATSGGPYTILNASIIPATTYTDTRVQSGQTYYYVARSIASDGVTESAYSDRVSVTVP